MQQIVSLEQAKEQGLKRYFTGKPCKYGHISERKVSSKNCLECHKEATRIRRGFYKPKVPKPKQSREEYLAKQKIYRDSKKKERSEYNKQWAARNRDKVAERCRRYQASKLKATPKWLSDEQIDEMVSIYKEARERSNFESIEYEVDHIVPLQSDIVCGLHVPWNLQVMDKLSNKEKSNKFQSGSCCGCSNCNTETTTDP